MNQPIKISEKFSYNQLNNNSWIPARYIKMPDKPDNVETKLLQDVVYINPDSRFFKDEEIDIENIKLIQGDSVDKKSGKILFPHDIEELPKRARLKAREGDILFPLLEVSMPTPVPVNEGEFLVSDYFAVLVPKRGVDKNYIIWTLRQDSVIKQIQSYYQGAKSLRLKLEDLRNVWIPWHEKELREEKVELIKEVLSKTTIQEEAIDLKHKIDLLISEHFGLKKEIFEKEPVVKRVCFDELKKVEKFNISKLLEVKPEELIDAEDFEVKSLGNLTKEINLGLQHSQIDEEIKKYLLKSNSIYPYRIESNMKGGDDLEFNLKKKYLLSKGELLVVVKGGELGTSAVITEKEVGLVFHNSLAKLVVDEDEVLPDYLSIYLNSFLGQYYVEKESSSSTVNYISKKQMKNIPVIIPSLKEQGEIVEVIDGE